MNVCSPIENAYLILFFDLEPSLKHVKVLLRAYKILVHFYHGYSSGLSTSKEGDGAFQAGMVASGIWWWDLCLSYI